MFFVTRRGKIEKRKEKIKMEEYYRPMNFLRFM
jgi:hypothetical protein